MKLPPLLQSLFLLFTAPVGAFATPSHMPFSGNHVQMRFEDPTVCNPGILELIGLEMEEFANKGQSAAVIFSLEPIRGGVGHSFVFMQSGSLRMPPQEFEVPVKELSLPALVGIYLCLDSTGRGSCASKPANVLNESMRRYEVTRDEAGAPVRTPEWSNPQSLPDEKIYFFQPLLIEAGAAKTLPTPLSSKPPSDLRKLVDPDKWRLWTTFSEKLHSLPLKVEAGRLTISLPRFSPDVCAALRAREHEDDHHEGHAHPVP